MKILFTVLFLIINLNLALGAGGYEKPSLFSPEATGLGGAVSSSVDGSTALIFNPAGINKDEAQLNISITKGGLEAPLFDDNQSFKTENDFIYPLGLMFSKKYSEKISYGFGVYGLAGLSIKYSEKDLGSLSNEMSTFSLDPYAELSVLEYNASVAYHFNKKLSLGLSIRGQQAEGGFSKGTVSYSKGLGGFGVPDGTLVGASNVELYDLEGSEFGSYNLGMQYKEKNWGFAFVYRSRVEFDLSGKARGDLAYSNTGSTLVNLQSGGAITPVSGQAYNLNGDSSNVTTEIPEQYKIGGHYILNKKHTIMLEYALTKYSNNDKLNISNTSLTNSLTGEKINVESINQNWDDLSDYKLGYQYRIRPDLKLRLGYVISSAVTNKNYASPLASPASKIYHKTIGIGKTILMKNNRYLELNATFENYSGEGSSNTESTEVTSTSESKSFTGNYKENVNSLMLGLTYGV